MRTPTRRGRRDLQRKHTSSVFRGTEFSWQSYWWRTSADVICSASAAAVWWADGFGFSSISSSRYRDDAKELGKPCLADAVLFVLLEEESGNKEQKIQVGLWLLKVMKPCFHWRLIDFLAQEVYGGRSCIVKTLLIHWPPGIQWH